jgi:hypothetical protein
MVPANGAAQAYGPAPSSTPTRRGARPSGAPAELSVAIRSTRAPWRRSARDCERRATDDTRSLYGRYGVVSEKSTHGRVHNASYAGRWQFVPVTQLPNSGKR